MDRLEVGKATPCWGPILKMTLRCYQMLVPTWGSSPEQLRNSSGIPCGETSGEAGGH